MPGAPVVQIQGMESVKDKIFAESIVLEIKQITGNDHYFYRRDLPVATNWLTEAIAKHGRNDLDAREIWRTCS